MAKPYLGVWLDHREAYLVWADARGETEVQHLRSAYEEQRKRGGMVVGGGAAFGGIPPHASLDDRRRHQSQRFYDRLSKRARRAEQIYIFGPGQARRELAKALREDKSLRARVDGVDAADRMTMPQMAARVREYFDLPSSPGAWIPRVA